MTLHAYDFGLVHERPRGRTLSVACLFSDLDRFWSKVDRSGGPEACWEWLASGDQRGYGLFRRGERIEEAPSGSKIDKAHRVAWEIIHGPIPGGLFVCHRCDVKPCCNPSHLFLGTHTDNMRDMSRKGRQWQQRVPLTNDLRCQIIDAYRNDPASYRTFSEACRTLASRFNVSASKVYRILITAGLHTPRRRALHSRRPEASPTTPASGSPYP